MRIRTKLRFVVFVPLLVALVVGSVLIFSFLTLKTALVNERMVDQIRTNITELNHIVYSYGTNREERSKLQFLEEHEKMTVLLAAVRFRNPDQQQLLEDIRLKSRSMKDTFLKLVTNIELPAPAGTAKLFKEAEKLLEGQLLITRKADSIAFALQKLVDEDIRKTQTKTFTFMFLVLVLTTFAFSFVLIRTGRSILSSLKKLRQGTEVIGAGDLNFVIEENKQDEIGELAQAFNQMTANLKEMTASKADLELEMTERQKAETELRTSRKFLEIANRHSDLEALLKDFVGEIKAFTGCEAVGVRLRDENGNIPYMAYQGFSQGFYESESPLSIKTDRCMCINVIKGTTDPGLSFYTEGGSFYMNGTTRFLATVEEEDKGQTRNVCNQTGFESVALIPIRLGTNILGLIHLADRQENRVPFNTVKLLEQAASALGIGIQRTLAEESLKKAYDSLEIKVAERTAELTAEIEQRKRTEEALRESEEELRYLSSQILVAQEKERREIAGDLHDHTWQLLNTIKIDIDQLLSQKMTEDFKTAQKTGKRIISNIRQAVERIRTMQGDLWPPIMDDIGLLPTINWYGREFEKNQSGITIEKEIGVTEEEVPQEIKIVIFRVIQEVLKNTARHSGASRVLLSLKKDGESIVLVVTDNGRGFDLEQILFRGKHWMGFGLMGMKERIEHSGGTFDIRAGEGSGTTVLAVWPLNGADPEMPDSWPIKPVFEKQAEPFRTVTEVISDWVYAVSVEPNGRFICDWITPGFKIITGYDIEDLHNGEDIAKIFHPEDRYLVKERFQYIKTFRPHVSEYRIITKSGEIRWVRNSINSVADPLRAGKIKLIGAAQDITERKRAEAEIIRQSVVLEGINRIFREALISQTDEELGRVCLAVAEEITQSKFGFVGEIGSDGLLHDIAISDPGWELCALPEKTGHRRPPGNFKIHGLYGRVLLDGKNLLTNIPSEHPDSVGTPPGHPPLKAFLGVPLIRNDKITGLIALGNREGGYTVKELESLEALAPAIVQAFARRRSETEIQRQVEELTRFNLAAVDRELRMVELKKQINDLCARLGQPPRYPLNFEPEQKSPAATAEVRA